MDLTGKLLIAMPGMGDERFEHTVVFLCSHTKDGAMGLIVNKTAPEVELGDLLRQLDIKPVPVSRGQIPVRFGGPVETQRGFVLHTPDYEASLNSLHVTEVFSMTATLDILEDIAIGKGPDQVLMMLGYAGWGAGQLENEIGMNGWLTVAATAALVFDTEDDQKWGAALQSIGVDPLGLSSEAGHA
ncbi:MAG: YqgE/AlgH family protein [Rhodobacteraceae bacterium]|nr:YqgE/AlgH family protein [Paracoccaceae bacterium]